MYPGRRKTWSGSVLLEARPQCWKGAWRVWLRGRLEGVLTGMVRSRLNLQLKWDWRSRGGTDDSIFQAMEPKGPWEILGWWGVLGGWSSCGRERLREESACLNSTEGLYSSVSVDVVLKIIGGIFKNLYCQAQRIVLALLDLVTQQCWTNCVFLKISVKKFNLNVSYCLQKLLLCVHMHRCMYVCCQSSGKSIHVFLYTVHKCMKIG